MRIFLATTFAAMAFTGLAFIGMAGAQQPVSDQDYIKQVMKAAPAEVAQHATVMRMVNGAMQTVRPGTNEWTCMDPGGAPMCMDPNAMEWGHAWMTHGPASEKTGFMYMLAGDTGASNTDPYATEKKPDNHWVQTGSHVMIVGAGGKSLVGYPKTADADPTKPYVMWPGTPYEHVMIPVK
jgi:hypothetical protein